MKRELADWREREGEGMEETERGRPF